MRRLAWLAIAFGLMLAYVGFVNAAPEPEVRPAQPATSEEIKRHELERLLELHKACGADRTTPPCDTLGTP